MSTNMPVQPSVVNRIFNPLKNIQAEPDSSTTRLSPAVACGPNTAIIERADDWAAAGYQMWEHCNWVSLRIQGITPFEILGSSEGGANTARVIEPSELQPLPTQRCDETEYEWDEYPEPLWDPLKSEVRLLVKEYFERADADTD